MKKSNAKRVLKQTHRGLTPRIVRGRNTQRTGQKRTVDTHDAFDRKHGSGCREGRRDWGRIVRRGSKVPRSRYACAPPSWWTRASTHTRTIYGPKMSFLLSRPPPVSTGNYNTIGSTANVDTRVHAHKKILFCQKTHTYRAETSVTLPICQHATAVPAGTLTRFLSRNWKRSTGGRYEIRIKIFLGTRFSRF